MLDVEKIISKIKLKEGQIVADLGVGRESKFVIPLAKTVGPEGRVYVADIVKSILPNVKNKTQMYGLNNVETVWTDLEIYGAAKAIISDTLDAGFLVTVLFQSTNEEAMIKESLRMVKKGGYLVIVDWKKTETPFGPDLARRVDPEKIKKICAKLNLKLIEEMDAGEYHFGLIFRK